MSLVDIVAPITMNAARKKFSDTFLNNLDQELNIIHLSDNQAIFYSLERIETGLELKYNIKPLRDDLKNNFIKNNKDEFLSRCIPNKIVECIKLLGLKDTYKLIDYKYNKVINEIQDVYINKIKYKNYLYIPIMVIEQLIDDTIKEYNSFYNNYFN